VVYYNLCLKGCIAVGKKKRYFAIKTARKFSKKHVSGEVTERKGIRRIQVKRHAKRRGNIPANRRQGISTESCIT
jgi:hypothetical protein